MTKAAEADVRRHRLSAVWIVPVVAMLLGLWLVIDAYRRQGPEVVIEFPTAEGLEEDTTPVKVRNVEIGVVGDIRLTEDLSGVLVTAELNAEARSLLREDTRFWVVRPRVSRTGISGLGTIVSGAYIEVSPGVGDAADDYRFTGLDHAPPTPAGTPGLRLNLVSDTSGSLGLGDPVLYRGYTVGRVERTELDVAAREVRYSIFVDAPYDSLITSSTRFWNASGISAEIGADGATLNVASLETLVSGGVAFDLPAGAAPGEAVAAEDTFQLFADRGGVDEHPHRYHRDYVVSFSQSVRGLSAGAPVTFRGIQVGTVQRIMVREGTAGALGDGRERPIPVLIRLEPGRFEMPDSPEGVSRLHRDLARAVDSGLRGMLESGSLITGSLYVNFDYVPDSPPDQLGEFAGYPALPTVSGGLARLQQQLGRLLTRLNELPLDQTVEAATRAIGQFEATAAEMQALLASDAAQTLPHRLNATLDQLDATLDAYSGERGLPDRLDTALTELERTLRRVRALAETLERNPNTLVFPTERPEDPEPRAGQP